MATRAVAKLTVLSRWGHRIYGDTVLCFARTAELEKTSTYRCPILLHKSLRIRVTLCIGFKFMANLLWRWTMWEVGFQTIK